MEDSRHGLRWSEDRGFEGVTGDAAIERPAKMESRFCRLGVGEVGAGGGQGVEGLEQAAVEESGERSVEEDGDGAWGLLDKEPVAEGFGSAAAESDDGVRSREGAREGAGLEAAELGLAKGGEDLRNGDAGEIGDNVVEVKEVPADVGRKLTANGRFAGAHEPGENDAR